MEVIRALIRRSPTACAVLFGAALLLKVLLPAGMMVSSQNQILTITICADASDQAQVRAIAIPMKRTGAENHDPAKAACPYSALAMAGLGGADPVLLALALAFVLALGFAAQPIRHLRRIARLRPPLRGPPLAA